MSSKTWYSNWFYILVFIFLASCSNYGARQLTGDRFSYNKSLQHSDAQQNLLNIVRLRYTDSPYFLSVGSVISQFSFARSADASVTNNSYVSALAGTGNASVAVSESPTITYLPLQGSDFVTRLLNPIDLSVIYTLLRAGWGINQLLSVMVQRLGPYENAVLASRVTSNRMPIYKDFRLLGRTLADLQRNGQLTFQGEPRDTGFTVRFTISSFKGLSLKQLFMFNNLGVNPKSPNFWLVTQPSPKLNEWFVESRTILGVLNFYSKGIDIPFEHIKSKEVPLTYSEDGKHIFDWRVLTSDFIHIRSSKSQPDNSFVQVEYRDYWYYIAQNDFASKEALNLLNILIGIYEGDVKSLIPVFTVS